MQQRGRGMCLAVGLVLVVSPLASAASASSTVGADPSLVAGYLAAPQERLDSASVRFKVPTVKCDGPTPSAATVGLGDVADLESPQVRAHVVLECTGGGSPVTSLAVLACGVPAGPIAVKHGSRVRLSIEQDDETVTTSATNERTGATISATGPVEDCASGVPLASVLYGALPVFAPDLLDPPDFNKIKSRDAALNGHLVSGQRLHRQTEPGIKAGRLKDPLADEGIASSSIRTGDTFTLRYRGIVHCCLREPSAGRPLGIDG